MFKFRKRLISITVYKNRVDELRNQGYSVVHGDGRDAESLQEAGIEDTKILAAMTRDDDANMLSTQLAKVKYDVETVVSRVGNDDNKEAFESLGVKVVSDSQSTAIEADNMIDRPALTNWIGNLSADGQVIDVELRNNKYANETTSTFSKELPGKTLILLIERDGHSIIPDGDTELELGDQLTFITQDESVGDIRFICSRNES